MISNPKTDNKRIVIVRCGFAGLKHALKFRNSNYKLAIEKNKYHQFQSLIYQVVSIHLDPSTIAFPLWEIFQHDKNFFLGKMELLEIDSPNNQLITSLSPKYYDKLVLIKGTKSSE